MDKATQKSIEWQKANNPMAIGGGPELADMVDIFNINPAFIAGYKEAEKDLDLTCEDVAKIDAIILDVNNEFAVDYSKEISRQRFYEEVLKRFNEQRKK